MKINSLKNTAGSLQNKPRGKPLAKGFDPRRNIKGVPKDTLLMRKHMRLIAAELLGKDETEMTRLDAMLRQLWTSRNPAHNKLALQVLDPKILQNHFDLTSAGQPIQIEAVEAFDYDAAVAAIAARPDEDRTDAAQDYYGGDGETLG